MDHALKDLLKFFPQQDFYLIKKYSLKDIDQYGPLAWSRSSNLQINKAAIFSDIEFENNLDDMLYRLNIYINRLRALSDNQKEIIKMTQIK